MTRVQTIPEVKVGDVDEMSKLASRLGLPICGQRKGVSSLASHCTRPAGHTESKDDHPSSAHVMALHKGIATAVWL